MSCREREVVLVRGPPWGFRVTGGSDTVHALKVEGREGEGEGREEGCHHLITGRSVVSTRAVLQRRE